MRVAVAQLPGVELRAWQDTRAQVQEAVVRAADERADLVVLPECVWPAYRLGSRAAYDAARRAGMPGPDDFLPRLRTLARDRRIAICAGYVDEVSGALRNAACLIDAEGNLLGVRHKAFLWAFDREVFEPGDVLEPIDAPFGRVGVLICADARLPEIAATLASRGATMLLQPTAWVNAGTPVEPWNPQPDFLIRSRAAEFGIPCASASKVGRELNTTFVGGSLICDAEGNIVAQCRDEPVRLLVAEVQPRTPRRPRVTNAERLALLADARPARPQASVPPLEIYAGVGKALPEPGKAGTLRMAVRPLGESPSAAPVAGDGGVVMVGGPQHELLELGPALGAIVADEAAQRFAPLRVSALLGIHFACVFGDGADAWHVRARACENRIFIVWSRRESVAVLDPRGRILAEAGWPAVGQAPARVCDIDLSIAANREVAWQTDILADRRPEHYAL